jgi:hypothetical protein
MATPSARFRGDNGLHFFPRRRRLVLIASRRFCFSASAITGTMTPSQPV